VPKRGGLFASEAFSTKLLEFMASGIPVIASKTKIDQYYFDDSMIVFFEPKNHEDLAKKIIELYNDPIKRHSVANNARKYVVQNNWDIKKHVFLDITKSLYEDTDQLKQTI
jgi:glycosyltransferase involved in cell wall biosynthesis